MRITSSTSSPPSLLLPLLPDLPPHTHSPGDGLQDLVGLYEVLDSHLHHGLVARWELLAQRVAQVHPQLFPTLVLIAQTKVVFLQNAQTLAHLLEDK